MRNNRRLVLIVLAMVLGMLQAAPVEHALVLVKGSHGIGLEKVLDLL